MEQLQTNSSPRINWHKVRTVEQLQKEGKSISEIARIMNTYRVQVRRYLRYAKRNS